MRFFTTVPLAMAAILWFPPSGQAQDVFKNITSDRLEDLLRGLNIQYKKGGDDKGTTWYDFSSKNQSLRLTNFSGKDLMIDVFLPPVEMTAINKWNAAAKFSRAHLQKDKAGKENAVIEWNLDLAGGVTDETIRHFVRSFDQEIAVWMKDPNLGKSTPAVFEEETFKNVSPERLEKILANLNITFKKTQGKGNNLFMYDFDRKNFKMRLTSFGGTDLMIDCNFPQATLAKINEWNVKRHYVRVVLYPGNGNPYTALESNIDCVAGVSENIVRYFITSFDSEATAFENHLKGSK